MKKRAVKEDSKSEEIINNNVVVHLVEGWVHTHGMNELGLPELEMKNIPLFLMRDAGKLINHIASYMHKNKDGSNPVKLGQRFATNALCVVEFKKATPIEGQDYHYESEVWEVVSADEYYKRAACNCCAKQSSQAN
jgi:hypothetical protein